jgi:DNA-binding response OmpR family regulator
LAVNDYYAARERHRRIASDVATVLEAAGYVVETVSDGEEAWFRGDTEDYGAIILDLGLPGMDGLSVLKRPSPGNLPWLWLSSAWS